MSALSIQVPFPVFTDRLGKPLNSGYIYIGEPGLDPRTNPVNVYWDDALTLSASQPLRTVNGYVANAGTPAQLYIDGVDYSVLVLDSKGIKSWGFDSATGIPADAGGISYTPPYTDAVATNVADKLAELISVYDFGASGDGVTDDTAAIVDAVAACYAKGAYLWWPDDNSFLTTSSIPNFHDVVHIGRGKVLRGADTFHILQENSGQENTIYYDMTSGDNTNDGLSGANPRKTLPNMRSLWLWFNTLGKFAQGYWIFSVDGAATNSSFDLGSIDINTAYPVQVVFNGATLTYNAVTGDAISTAGGSVEYDGTLTINGNSLLSNAVFVRRGQARIKGTATFTVNDATVAFTADDGSYFQQDSFTTTTNNCGEGFVANNSNCTDYSTHNNPQYGTTCTRNTTMHVRTVVNDASECALLINHGARVDLEPGNDWKRCAVGVITHDSATLSISSSSDLADQCNMGTADACTIMAQQFGSSNNGAVTGNAAFPYQLLGLRNDTLTASSSTSNQQLGAIYGTTTIGIKQIPAYYMADKGKMLRFIVYGNITGTAGAKTISLRTNNLAGTDLQILASRSLGTGAGRFRMTVTVKAVTATSQIVDYEVLYESGAAETLDSTTTTVDYGQTRTHSVYCIKANAADGLTVDSIEMYGSL